MWTIYQTTKLTHQRPSELVGVTDRWAALQFDNAVCFLGNVLENARQEQEKVGMGKFARWKPKYTMEQLLDPAFKLPRPGQITASENRANIMAFARALGMKQVKVVNG